MREPLRSCLVIGLLFVANLFFFGGPSQVVRYTSHPIHVETSRSLLRGTLALPYGVGAHVLATDLEARNGSWYTHWGYGVPLLQVPFHLFGAFPDRLIFFFYLCVVTTLLFWGVRKSWGDSLTAGIFTAAALSFSLYWLISFRFQVYEQTIAYSVLVQFAAIGWFCLRPERAGVLGAILGMGILVRPTGLIFALVWGVIQRRQWKYFLLGLLPFLLVAPLGMRGFRDSIPFFADHLLPVRFGVTCGSFVNLYGEILWVLFLGGGADSTNCGFRMEGIEKAPFLGVWVVVLLLIGGFKKKVAPVWLLGILGLLFLYSSVGMGFADRYAAEFAAFLVLGAVFLRFPKPLMTGILCLLFLLSSYRVLRHYDGFVESSSTPTRLGDESKPTALPSSLECDGSPGYRQGWAKNCATGAVTEFFIGVPEEEKSNWELRLEGVTNVDRLYVNGEYLPARKEAAFTLDPRRLHSRNILVSILWKQGTWNSLTRAEIR